jgi:tetratricopeptide (TPR) repeat protein
MVRSRGFLALCAPATLGALAFQSAAKGAPEDASALKLREEAVYTDYLATNFKGAEERLAQALARCSRAADCAPSVVARIQCDLGAVLFNDQKTDEARAHFSLAFKQDPNVAIDEDLASPEMQRIFATAREGVPTIGAPLALPVAAAQDDIKHTPPTAEAILTPVPIYAELGAGATAARVIARYKAFGMEKWKTMVLRKLGAGWGGEIPCFDVGDSTGALKYFIQATDENGDLVATSGRLVAPHVVQIVTAITGQPPHLPGAKPPSQCTQKSDCPPGFPGCEDGSNKKACAANDDCPEGQACQDGACEATSDETPRAAFKKNWLTLGFQAEVLSMPSAVDACAGGKGYTCFDSHGTYYSGVPLLGADDAVSGGPAIATMRVLLGYDRVVGQQLLVGGRLGYAFNGGPQRPGAASFLPVHAEGRLSFWFGHDPLGRAGFRFFALVAGGVAEVDAGVQVDAYASSQAYATGQSQNYVAWRKTGLGFAAEGLGAMYATTPSSGVVLEIKALEMFPTLGLGAGLRLGYAIGL